MLTNSDDKKERHKMNCYILHRFISDHITIDNCYYLLSLCKTLVKTKRHRYTNNINMENNEFKNVCKKHCICYCFNDIIKLEDFDFDNILIDEKLC